MPVLKIPQEIQVSNGMAQFYRCFIKTITLYYGIIIKLIKKVEVFEWTTECQTAWEDINNRYIQAHILISPTREL
jgi:hypothetical protein